MRIFFICLLTMLLTFNVKAQEEFVSRYFSLDSVEISNEKFQNLRNSKKNMVAYFRNQNDNMYIKLVDRMIIGQVSPLQVNQTLAYFRNQKQSIDTNLPTVIQYFQGDDLCSRSAFGGQTTPWDNRDSDLETSLKKKFDINFLNIKSNLSNVDNRTNLPTNWINDKYSMLKKFFPYHYPCGSFMIFKPNGEYYVNYGEYGVSTVLEALKKFKVTKAR